MPRTLSAALLNHFNSSSTTTCYITRITRRDGKQLGFAFTDEPITYSGLTYYPQGSISATSLSQTADNGVDNLDFQGALSALDVLHSNAVTDGDLRRGLYDGAEIIVSEVNYNDLTQGAMLCIRGYVGEVQVNSNGQYTCELRSLEQFMSVQIGDMIAPTCRCRRLGDYQCKVPIANYTAAGTVSPNDPNNPINLMTSIQANDVYSGGVLRITSGANTGIERDIKQYLPSGQVLLQEPYPFAVEASASMAMEQGCDRRFVTCDTVYGNTVNFHGEPYLPGTDKLLGVARPPS